MILAYDGRVAEDDLLEQVPSGITISKISDLWYLTTTHGDPGGEHDHIEIKLDRKRLRELYHQAIAALIREP